MDTYHDPHTMLPEQRFAEAAKLLARGFLRTIRGQRDEPDSVPAEESANTCATVSYSLDAVRVQSVHATVNHQHGE
jgi:hypothetical protein